MGKPIQNYLFANTDVESRNREVKNPRLEAESSVKAQGSQEENENKALKEPRLRNSTQISEQKDSQKKEPSNHELKKENLVKKYSKTLTKKEDHQNDDAEADTTTDSGVETKADS